MVCALPFASEIAKQECLDRTVPVQTSAQFTVSGQRCRYSAPTRMNARESP